MSEHTAMIRWKWDGADFSKGKYSREHTWTFDCGVTVAASPSPAVVPVPYSNPRHVDPEEAFVASVSSCHMLTFLYLASQRAFLVESYEDAATGLMTKNARGIPWVSSIILRPKIVYREKKPTRAEEDRLHHAAHEQCFIANSIQTVVTVEQMDNNTAT